MRIAREGMYRNHGTSSVTLPNPSFGWDSESAQIIVTQGYVDDFSTEAQHHYTISVSLDEFRRMVEIVAQKGLGSAEGTVGKGLPSCLKSLARLLAASVEAS